MVREVDYLLEKVQVAGEAEAENPPAPGQLVLEKEARAWVSQSLGLRWQMPGKAAAAASTTQMAGPWAPGDRRGGRAQEAGRTPCPPPCTAAPSVPLQSVPLWLQCPHLQTVQRPHPL